MWSSLKRSASAMKGALSSWPGGVKSKLKRNFWEILNLFRLVILSGSGQRLDPYLTEESPALAEWLWYLCVVHLRSCLDDLVPLDLAPHHERVHRSFDVVRRRLFRLKKLAVGESVLLILLMRSKILHNLRVASEKIARQLWESWGQWWWCS